MSSTPMNLVLLVSSALVSGSIAELSSEHIFHDKIKLGGGRFRGRRGYMVKQGLIEGFTKSVARLSRLMGLQKPPSYRPAFSVCASTNT